MPRKGDLRMGEAPELHDLIKLMLARMETHPEEFGDDFIATISSAWPPGMGRWTMAIRAIDEYGTEADVKAFKTAYNKLRMDKANEWAMDELYNGDERRRAKEEENKAYMAQLAALNRQSMQSAQSSWGQLQAGAGHLQAGTGILSNNGTWVSSTSLDNTLKEDIAQYIDERKKKGWKRLWPRS